MDREWYFKLPDFNNQNEWVEGGRLGFYFNPPNRAVLFCDLESLPDGLAMGIVISRHNISNPALILYEYCDLKAENPILLKWWDENNRNLIGMAMLSEEIWQIKKINENLEWKVKYDFGSEKVISYEVTFEIGSGGFSKLN